MDSWNITPTNFINPDPGRLRMAPQGAASKFHTLDPGNFIFKHVILISHQNLSCYCYAIYRAVYETLVKSFDSCACTIASCINQARGTYTGFTESMRRRRSSLNIPTVFASTENGTKIFKLVSFFWVFYERFAPTGPRYRPEWTSLTLSGYGYTDNIYQFIFNIIKTSYRSAANW